MIHFLLLVALFIQSVQGHAIVTPPTPRVGMAVGNGVKNKGDPTPEDLNSCKINGKPTIPGPIAATYVAGAQVSVKWDLKKVHPSAPGVRIAIKYPGEDQFIVLAKNIDIKTLEAKVSLPTQTCKGCVLQWVSHNASDGFYVGCSDISIKAADAPGAPSTSNCRRA